MDPYDPYPPAAAPRRRRRTDRARDLLDDDDRLWESTTGAEQDSAPRPGPLPWRDDAPPEPAYSSWLDAVHGPQPRPAWLVTDLGAVDTDLGVLKTGKEADVHLLERAVPGGAGCLLAAKRYRSGEHRLFHRDAGYLEGRRMRRSRENRAMARRTDFGRELISQQWAAAEFAALSRLWALGRRTGALRVPYPAQLHGTELLMEFVGDAADGEAAPRLAQLRPDGDELRSLWEQLLGTLLALAAEGIAHGDLSPYNLLVHRGELVLIDLPQVVDVVGNPQGPVFLARDVAVTTAWFRARGLPADVADPAQVTQLLLHESGLN